MKGNIDKFINLNGQNERIFPAGWRTCPQSRHALWACVIRCGITTGNFYRITIHRIPKKIKVWLKVKTQMVCSYFFSGVNYKNDISFASVLMCDEKLKHEQLLHSFSCCFWNSVGFLGGNFRILHTRLCTLSTLKLLFMIMFSRVVVRLGLDALVKILLSPVRTAQLESSVLHTVATQRPAIPPSVVPSLLTTAVLTCKRKCHLIGRACWRLARTKPRARLSFQLMTSLRVCHHLSHSTWPLTTNALT